MTHNGQNISSLDDTDAENYINSTLTHRESEPLLFPSDYQRAPPDDIYQHFPSFAPNPYYVQQSYDARAEEQKFNSKYISDKYGMSPVRRMFCLLALFDCLMTLLMWIIYIRIAGGILKYMKKEVLQYNFRTSYFDIVASSFGRAVILLLAYACIFKSKRWYFIAFTTTASSIFLLTKVFKSEFKIGAPMNYLLIIFEFVICWCEAWHFDYQVIPLEIQKEAATKPPSSASIARNVFQPSVTQGSNAYFTPYAGSVFKAQTISERSEQSDVSNLSEELINATENQTRLWIRKAKDNVHVVFRMLYIHDGWDLERQECDGIKVSSRNFDGIGKVFKLEMQLDACSRLLTKLFWEDVETHYTWNNSIKECQIFERINEKTDIVYSTSSETAGGVIASRDFVNLRRLKKKGPLTLLCALGIETEYLPQKNSIIRGHNGPGGFILREIQDEPNKTDFIWLLNTDIKGWLPTRLVEQSIGGVMLETAKNITRHVATLQNNGTT